MYAHNLQETLRLAYDSAGHLPDSQTVIEVTIEMTGLQTSSTVLHSSGSADFDHKCQRTLREASPYQPFGSNVLFWQLLMTQFM